MTLRMLLKGWRFRKKRAALALAAFFLGSALTSALLGLYLNVNDKVGQELRNYGANIQVLPKGSELIDESQLSQLKQIFWKHNIMAFAPYLKVVGTLQGDPVVISGTWFDHTVTVPGENPFVTGIKGVAPWWKIEGQWPTEKGVLVGSDLAQSRGLKVGDTITLTYNGKQITDVITGILSTGGSEENQVVTPLAKIQALANLPGKVGEVKISALTKPEDQLALTALKDPKALSPKDYEKWYCSPYMSSIVFQVNEVITSGDAKPIAQVAKAENTFLSKINLMVLLVTIVTLVASSLSVMTTATANILERRTEIGILKSLGADNTQVALLFLLEFVTLGLFGGFLGYLAGIWLTKAMSILIFGSPIIPGLLVLPATLALSVIVAVIGSASQVYQATQVKPALVLHGE